MSATRFDRVTKAFGTRLSRRTALAAGAGLGGLALASTQSRLAAAQEATPAASPPAEAGPAWLLLQRFAGATLSPGPDGAVLILTGVEPTVLAFTDRPARLARSVPAADAWTWTADPADPPNATLLAVPAEGGDEVALVVELLAPSYDEGAGQVTATVRVLGDGSLAAVGSPTAVTAEQRFGAGHLFIDDLILDSRGFPYQPGLPDDGGVEGSDKIEGP